MMSTMKTYPFKMLIMTAIGLMISGCSQPLPRLPDPKMTEFKPKKHEQIGKVHGIRGSLLKDGRNWELIPKRDGVYLCIKVDDYLRIKQRCNDTLYDLRRCDVINNSNVRKCNALVAAYNKDAS